LLIHTGLRKAEGASSVLLGQVWCDVIVREEDGVSTTEGHIHALVNLGIVIVQSLANFDLRIFKSFGYNLRREYYHLQHPLSNVRSSGYDNSVICIQNIAMKSVCHLYIVR